MFTLIGFYEAQDGLAALHPVKAIQDSHINTNGDDVRIPRFAQNIIGYGVLSAADTALTSARLISPALRRVANIEIGTLINALVWGDQPETIIHPENPIPVLADEALNLQINSDAASALGEYGLVWLSDGQQSKVTGQMYSIGGSSAVTLSAGTWVNGSLSFSQTLPVGRYQIVGMRARGTNLVAARLNFVGGTMRPGVPAINALGDKDTGAFRYGNMGVFGEFDSITPPTIDCLGATDSAQDYIFDLIKVG